MTNTTNTEFVDREQQALVKFLLSKPTLTEIEFRIFRNFENNRSIRFFIKAGAITILAVYGIPAAVIKLFTFFF